MKEWFHNTKERVVDKIGDHRDYWVYQKKYWHHSNFFIFLNWLSRGWLEDRIFNYIHCVKDAEKWLKWAADAYDRGNPEAARHEIDVALEALKIADERQRKIFKI